MYFPSNGLAKSHAHSNARMEINGLNWKVEQVEQMSFNEFIVKPVRA